MTSPPLPVYQAAKLASFEIVKAVHLEPALWTADSLLTPTFKLKRADAKRAYQAAIDRMYEATGDAVAGKSGLKQGSAMS